MLLVNISLLDTIWLPCCAYITLPFRALPFLYTPLVEFSTLESLKYIAAPFVALLESNVALVLTKIVLFADAYIAPPLVALFAMNSSALVMRLLALPKYTAPPLTALLLIYLTSCEELMITLFSVYIAPPF